MELVSGVFLFYFIISFITFECVFVYFCFWQKENNQEALKKYLTKSKCVPTRKKTHKIHFSNGINVRKVCLYCEEKYCQQVHHNPSFP